MPVAMPMQASVGLAQQGVPLTILRNIQFHTGTTPQDFHHQVGLRVRRGGTHADGLVNTNGRAEAGMRHRHHRHRHAQGHPIEQDTGPFREEDAFYKPRTRFHPATAELPRSQPFGATVPRIALASAAPTATAGTAGGDPSKKDPGFFKPFTTRGKEQGRRPRRRAESDGEHTSAATTVPTARDTVLGRGYHAERVTKGRESGWDSTVCQYVMWEVESFPREFVKCRRCRKVKHCGKVCQYRAWSEGHRFWCSAREGEDGVEGTHHANAGCHANAGYHDGGGDGDGRDSSGGDVLGGGGGCGTTVGVSAATAARVERRKLERERERQQLANAGTTTMDPNSVDTPGGLPRAIAIVGATTAQIQSASAQSTDLCQQRQASASTIRVAGPHAIANMKSRRLIVRDRTNDMARHSNTSTAFAAALNTATDDRTEYPRCPELLRLKIPRRALERAHQALHPSSRSTCACSAVNDAVKDRPEFRVT
ncbi:hypothetical protein BD410DRAFT_840060 [Rickenella mellea]|uniref:MYND-type domain-containing protein n=1 Tax=Rickenella mellea TaxID=50990 RepID=A0A4Y7Q4S5_9AGAM|nr:hypothetical protein BD410DRAFT_840060 [Rickenella mellea]